MAWNENITTNQRSLGKAILSLFIVMVITSCAGTDSSVQKKGEEISGRFKVGTPTADTLVSSMPEFAHSIFKRTIDSVPGEYYYNATNGRIDTLFQKDGEVYKAIAFIAYNSPNGQESYGIKKGDYSYKVKDGVLAEEFFPNHFKEYWNNGKTKIIATGLLYRDDHGVIKMDSGRSEIYSESGKMLNQKDWKNKQVVLCKDWNKNGQLIIEIIFPKYFNEYYDNGKIKEKGTGLLYRDNQGVFRMDSGHSEVYFENGKIKQQNDWKDKQLVTQKVWNENGILIKEFDFPKYFKEYWDNGKLKGILTGFLYRDNQGNFDLDSGHSEFFFENGKISEQIDWKNKQHVAYKIWNENGVLIKEMDFPKYIKGYWDNGKTKGEMTGILYRDSLDNIKLDSGHEEFYFENGNVKQQNDWKDKQVVAQKEWNESGILTKEFVFPNYYKEYWGNGKTKSEMTGILYRDNQGIVKMDNGHSETYFENGKINQQNDWKDKQLVAQKMWNENGVLIKEIDFPQYLKEYWENGKAKLIATGLLYRVNQVNIEVDSGHSEIYFENGKIKEQNDWKNKEAIISKQWNKNGTLIRDFVYPQYFKEYWDNGKLKAELTGILYRNNQGNFDVDSGHSEIFFENGKIKQQNDLIDKQLIAQKEWNENGTLTKEIKFPEYWKEFWDNGKLKNAWTGIHYRNEKGLFGLDSGRAENFSKNGKILEQIDWQNKHPIASKQWNEKGTLIRIKANYDNGNVKYEGNGTIIEENGSFKIKDGTYNERAPSGEVTYFAIYQNFKIISEKK